MRKIAVLVCLCLGLGLAACAGRPPPPRYQVAEAGRRTPDWLLSEAAAGTAAARARALRVLGRIGDEGAVAALKKALATATDESVVVAAVEGLWFADTGAAEVARAYGHASDPVDLAVLRALGRLATAAELPILEKGLADKRPAVRAAAGVAVGVAGRRKIAYTPAIRASLRKGLGDLDPRVRYGAAMGLATEPDAKADGDLTVALVRLEGPPEARALAIKALGQRGAPQETLERGLHDADVWVRVEAVRALSSPKSTPDMRARLAAWLEDEWSVGADGARLHPLLEGLTRLQGFSKEAPVGDALQRMHDAVPRAGRVAADVVQCRTAAGLVRRGAGFELLSRCGGPPTEGWPLWARRQLVAEAVKDGAGTASERRAALVNLASDPDERVRAAVPDAAAALLPDADAALTLRAALADKSVAVAENACDALAGLEAKAPPWAGEALAAMAPRAEKEPELRQSLLDALAALKVDRVEIFEKALSDPSPAVRKKARDGLAKLGHPAPPETPEPPQRPPIDVAAAGGRPILVVATTQGTFHVELAADVAPWNVATLVTLAERHFFDGTSWHRVVPGFVVQGGDPTGTGAGGPGFSVVAEPSNLAYLRGTVGIADAGKDTGGSQWFVMHAPAPHLDGRYTIVGQVPEIDQAVVDKLIVGDRILRVEVKR